MTIDEFAKKTKHWPNFGYIKIAELNGSDVIIDRKSGIEHKEVDEEANNILIAIKINQDKKILLNERGMSPKGKVVYNNLYNSFILSLDDGDLKIVNGRIAGGAK